MLRLGNYEYSLERDFGYYKISFRPAEQSGTKNKIKNHDHMLHESIDQIFRERCLSNSDKIKEYLCESQHHTDRDPVIKAIVQIMSSRSLKKLSLLWISVLSGYQQSAELLVRSGADVNKSFGRRKPQIINKNCTILHVLLQMHPSPENDRLIRLIADHGADLKVRDCKGQTVLHYAVLEGRIQMIEMLLEKGADVNAADNYGVTPLFTAASNRKALKLVPLLIKNGANVFAENRNGENVLHYLGQANPHIHTAEVVKIFIEMGVSIHDRTNKLDLQSIHLAAMYRNYKLVKALLDHGANVNAQAYDGTFPLYFAALFQNNVAVVELLLERGANVNQKLVTDIASRCTTALHTVCEFFYEEYIRLLLSYGAEVTIENDYGQTALDIVLSDDRKNSSSVKLIIAALALKKVCQPTIKLNDEKIIEQCPILRMHYRESIEQIEKMKLTRFTDACTLYEFLTKCHCQLAAFMRNPNLETKFRRYDLSDFSTYYAKIITRAFERAHNHYHSMLEQEEIIVEAVYNILPYEIVRSVAHYICNCCKNVK